MLTPICEALTWKDEKLLGVTLEAIDAILRVGELLKENRETSVNPYVILIEEVSVTKYIVL